MSEPPKEIWLQWHGDARPDDPGEPTPSEVTWWTRQVFDHDVRYVRADTVDKETDQ